MLLPPTTNISGEVIHIASSNLYKSALLSRSFEIPLLMEFLHPSKATSNPCTRFLLPFKVVSVIFCLLLFLSPQLIYPIHRLGRRRRLFVFVVINALDQGLELFCLIHFTLSLARPFSTFLSPCV